MNGRDSTDSMRAGNSHGPTDLLEEERHVGEILAGIAGVRQAILDGGGPGGSALRADQCVFLTFWDFDGTILRGDCVEGGPGYTGLLEELVRCGLCHLYPATDEGVTGIHAEYQRRIREDGLRFGYQYPAMVVAGAGAMAVEAACRRHFASRQRREIFDSALRILRALEGDGVENHVLSATPDVFLRGIAAEMGWNPGFCRGIRTEIRGGIITDHIEYPVTFAEGKTEALREQVEDARRRHPGKRIFVLAGFGNSSETDGHFLRHVADNSLPAGKALAVMVNLPQADGTSSYLHVRQVRTCAGGG